MNQRLWLKVSTVSPDKPDREDQTHLLHATCSGHEGVVEILRGGAEVNPDKPDNDGWTPLLHVALEAHERVVKRLT